MAEDGELLDAWRAGDAEAGERLVERHFKVLYRFFRTKFTVGVEDLVQETLLACVEGRDRIRSGSSFRAYLLGIARRLVCDRFAASAGRSFDPSVTSVADVDPSPSHIVAEREEQRLMLAALRHLPLDFQIALELYYVEELRGPEIADVLEIPEATVRSRLRRGLEQARAQLEKMSRAPELVPSTIDDVEGWARSLRDLVAPS